MGLVSEWRYNYRLFLFDGEGPRAHAIKFDCDNDNAALRRAEQLRSGRMAELWRHDKVVKVFRGGK